MKDWKERLTYLDFTNRIDIAEWTELVNFISSLLAKEKMELVELKEKYQQMINDLNSLSPKGKGKE